MEDWARFEKKLDKIRQRVNKNFGDVAKRDEPKSLYEPLRYVSDGSGKRLRPALVMLSCEAVGGEMDDALDAAVAIEMIHNFTLVHDDIMDKDDYRRGRQTVHRKWDNDVAILTGDALVIFAYQSLAKINSIYLSPVLDAFTNGVLEVCEGQALDKEFEKRSDVTLDEYIEMINKKTGRLMAVSTETGAMIGGGDTETVIAFKRYGEGLGRAFQIQDDLLDIIAEQDVLGKDIGSDLIQGKKTYPFLLTIQDPEQNKLIQDALKKTNRGNVTAIKKVMQDHGIIDTVRSEMKRQVELAKKNLLYLERNIVVDDLFKLTDMILHREF